MLQLFTLSAFSELQEKVRQESPNFSQVIPYIYLHIHFMYQYVIGKIHFNWLPLKSL